LRAKLALLNQRGGVMGTTGVGSRLLLQLSFECRIVRTRPVGTWVSGQYRWADMEAWLGSPISELSDDEAGFHLLTAWLRAFGPGTETDIKWWAGWPLGKVRSTLAAVGAREVELDQGVGYVHPDDLDPVDPPPPWVALLPALDPTTMGWKERDWYLGPHADRLFDRNGNAGPTVWVNGRIVGGWAQRPDGSIAHEILEDVTKAEAAAIAARIDELRAWMDHTTVTPRFTSPHARELTD
jgi:DNA glycosylase AlkZ-like